MIRHLGDDHSPGRWRFALAFLAVIAMLAAERCAAQSAPTKDQAAEAKPAAPATSSQQINEAITALGSRSFEVREKASDMLWRAGPQAEPALRKAVAESDDCEVVFRARQILRSFELGIYADTPPEVLAQIHRFRLGNQYQKQEVARELVRVGKKDLLRRLIAQESNPMLQRQLRAILENRPVVGSSVVGRVRLQPAVAGPQPAEVAKEVRTKLAARDFDAAEQLLRGASDDALMRDYAALLLGRNRLDATIAQLRAGAKAEDSLSQRRLAWLLRGKGDLAGAVTAAKAAKDSRLVERLLVESGDWKELARLDGQADLDALSRSVEGVDRLGKIIAYRRLAGDKQGSGQAIDALIRAMKRDGDGLRLPFQGLLLNGQSGPCVEILSASSPVTAFQLLVAQNRPKDAFRLAGIELKDGAKTDWVQWLKAGQAAATSQRLWYGVYLARALVAMGEDDRADELIAAIRDMVLEQHPANHTEALAVALLETVVLQGNEPKIDAVLARLLAKDADFLDEAFKEAFDRQADAARLLWKAIRQQHPDEERPAALQRLRRLLVARPDATAIDELRRLSERIDRQIDQEKPDDASEEEPSGGRGQKLLAMARLFHRIGQNESATAYLRKLGILGLPTAVLIEQGNLFADAKQWDLTARAYDAAWSKDRGNATALYLSGWVQMKRGREDDGRQRMETALIMPLGEGESRLELIQTLLRLGKEDEAARQRQTLLRTAGPEDRAVVATLMAIGEAGRELPDGPNPAEAARRQIVLLLNRGLFMLRTEYYLVPPRAAHRMASAALLRAGRTAEALDELRQAEALLPTDVELAIDLCPLLRKHGAEAEAEALYRRVIELHEALCRDFPRSSKYHNDLAWTAASLDRDLDKALAHARRAVELKPNSAMILDTLAEVQFRLGNREEAIRLEKRCLELDAEGEHYKKQLARFEKRG